MAFRFEMLLGVKGLRDEVYANVQGKRNYCDQRLQLFYDKQYYHPPTALHVPDIIQTLLLVEVSFS